MGMYPAFEREPAMTVETMRPVPAYRTKLILAVTLLYVLIGGFSGGFGYLIGLDAGDSRVALTVLAWILGVTAILYLLSLLIAIAYYPTLEYLVDIDEVIVRAGVITKSVKHVPYRTVTNLKVRRDPLDRLLGIGSLQIQTAGMSGQSGVEESLSGLREVDRVYEEVAQTLRRFRQAMDGTAAGALEPAGADDGTSELLAEVRRIRKLLEIT